MSSWRKAQHSVARVLLQVEQPSLAAAQRVSKRLDEDWQTRLRDVMATALSRWNPHDASIVLPRVELDVGVLSRDDWESELLERLSPLLLDALGPPPLAPPRTLRERVAATTEGGVVARLTTRLRAGVEPWWAHDDGMTTDALLTEVLAQHADEFSIWLKGDGNRPEVWQRLAEQTSTTRVGTALTSEQEALLAWFRWWVADAAPDAAVALASIATTREARSSWRQAVLVRVLGSLTRRPKPLQRLRDAVARCGPADPLSAAWESAVRAIGAALPLETLEELLVGAPLTAALATGEPASYADLVAHALLDCASGSAARLADAKVATKPRVARADVLAWLMRALPDRHGLFADADSRVSATADDFAGWFERFVAELLRADRSIARALMMAARGATPLSTVQRAWLRRQVEQISVGDGSSPSVARESCSSESGEAVAGTGAALDARAAYSTEVRDVPALHAWEEPAFERERTQDAGETRAFVEAAAPSAEARGRESEPPEERVFEEGQAPQREPQVGGAFTADARALDQSSPRSAVAGMPVTSRAPSSQVSADEQHRKTQRPKTPGHQRSPQTVVQKQLAEARIPRLLALGGSELAQSRELTSGTRHREESAEKGRVGQQLCADSLVQRSHVRAETWSAETQGPTTHASARGESSPPSGATDTAADSHVPSSPVHDAPGHATATVPADAFSAEPQPRSSDARVDSTAAPGVLPTDVPVLSASASPSAAEEALARARLQLSASSTWLSVEDAQARPAESRSQPSAARPDEAPLHRRRPHDPDQAMFTLAHARSLTEAAPIRTLEDPTQMHPDSAHAHAEASTSPAHTRRGDEDAVLPEPSLPNLQVEALRWFASALPTWRIELAEARATAALTTFEDFAAWLEGFLEALLSITRDRPDLVHALRRAVLAEPELRVLQRAWARVRARERTAHEQHVRAPAPLEQLARQLSAMPVLPYASSPHQDCSLTDALTEPLEDTALRALVQRADLSTLHAGSLLRLTLACAPRRHRRAWRVCIARWEHGLRGQSGRRNRVLELRRNVLLRIAAGDQRPPGPWLSLEEWLSSSNENRTPADASADVVSTRQAAAAACEALLVWGVLGTPQEVLRWRVGEHAWPRFAACAPSRWHDAIQTCERSVSPQRRLAWSRSARQLPTFAALTELLEADTLARVVAWSHAAPSPAIEVGRRGVGHTQRLVRVVSGRAGHNAEVEEEALQRLHASPAIAALGPLRTRTSGVVLLHPYLPMLLSRLGLWNDAAGFASRGAQTRATQLLHWLASARESAREVDMTLEKLLCGVPPSLPVPEEWHLSSEEKQLAQGMLSAAIEHWGSLGHTSIEGLRGSFLCREGLLERRNDEYWELTVAKRTWDVLLSTLPWSLSMFTLPWLEEPFHVRWI